MMDLDLLDRFNFPTCSCAGPYGLQYFTQDHSLLQKSYRCILHPILCFMRNGKILHGGTL